jgi:hypothetical protein
MKRLKKQVPIDRYVLQAVGEGGFLKQDKTCVLVNMVDRIPGLFLLLLMCWLGVHSADGQVKDTTRTRIFDSKVSKEIMEAVTRKPLNGGGRTEKSEDIFRPYQGRIIRHITVRRIGFEKTLRDTSRTMVNRITRLANALHKDTREQVIRDNLFFRINKPLDPYKLADNERYLRDLSFILDSKIVVHPVGNSIDSVDVEVITRDVFSFGVKTRAKGIDGFSVSLYDANLMGWGQRLQGDFLFEHGRDPLLGVGVQYTKSSIGGSLINGSVGYTQLDDARSAGEEIEYAYYLRLDRPLVSPYSRMAGGLEISKNWSMNVYNTPDSAFKRYRYNARDFWVGYNIGIKNNMNNRKRNFVALRYFEQDFYQQPGQEAEKSRRIYNDQQALLGEFTFYDQNFYKTNYVYGFGRTEDIPYGQTVNLTLGWSEELALRRMYLGTYAIKRIVRPSGRFYDMEAGMGTFFNNKKAEDGVLYVNGAFYSKLYNIKKSKVRHQFAGGYAWAFNNRVRELLTINRELKGFSSDSLYGYQRLFLRTETTVFTPWHLIGFRFAPFLSLEGAFFQPTKHKTVFEDFFWGTTGGLRIRNENLIFGTIEFRMFYFPTTVPGVDPVSFKVTTNVRIKYSGSFVRAPEFVRYN